MCMPAGLRLTGTSEMQWDNSSDWTAGRDTGSLGAIGKEDEETGQSSMSAATWREWSSTWGGMRI